MVRPNRPPFIVGIPLKCPSVKSLYKMPAVGSKIKRALIFQGANTSGGQVGVIVPES
jgi:hypothetical protein